jgi:nucleoside-diphosphate-sugar epimerase
VKTAAVTGATGFLGQHLCRELVAAGYSVRGLHRDTSDTSLLKGMRVEPVLIDLADRGSLRTAFAGISTVFHIASLFREAKFPEAEYRAVNVEGTRNVFEAAMVAGVDRVIHCSTVGVHSHIPSPPADENEPYRPADIYQATKAEGERVALAYQRSGRIGGCVIRPAMIWGPGDRRTLKLFRLIQKRRLPVIGSGRTLVHWVMVSDVARAFRQAAEAPGIDGEVFIVAGRESVSMSRLFQLIANALGVRPLKLRVPALPLQLLGAVVQAVSVPLGIEPPIHRRRVDFFTKTRSFDDSKARRTLGYAPTGSLEEEIAQIVASYRAMGAID